MPLAVYWAVIASLLCSFLLSVYPLPFVYQYLRPEWTAMVVIFWATSLPGRVGVGTAWLAGLVLDGIKGVTLGQNALSLAVIAYLCQALHQRVRHFAPLQQAGVVFVLVGLHLLSNYWVQGFTSGPDRNMNFLASAASSAVFWPFLAALLHSLSRVSAIQRA